MVEWPQGMARAWRYRYLVEGTTEDDVVITRRYQEDLQRE